jgi:two-component sensor histidine kinase
LSVNAVKYGALSKPEGRVLINWRTDEGPPPEFVFKWEEQDGPAVIVPEKTGFGSQVIEKALAHDTGGKVEMQYASTGLKYSFAAPLKRIQASPPQSRPRTRS